MTGRVGSPVRGRDVRRVVPVEFNDAPVLVLQHAAWEGPGLIARGLEQRDIPWTVRTVLDEHDPHLPDVSRLGGLVVMGGAAGALDDDEHPGLVAERNLLVAAVEADIPVLGVCLGMQLLAVAHGAALHAGAHHELGFGPVAVTGDGIRDPYLYPLVVDAHADPDVLHWHEDGVEAPDGATVLASTHVTPVQAFRLGSATAFQFHLEVDAPMLGAWLDEPETAEELTADQIAAIREQGRERLPSLGPRAFVGLGTFADAVRYRRG